MSRPKDFDPSDHYIFVCSLGVYIPSGSGELSNPQQHIYCYSESPSYSPDNH